MTAKGQYRSEALGAVSKNLVSDWEWGKRKPGRPALKLLDVIQKQWTASDGLVAVCILPLY